MFTFTIEINREVHRYQFMRKEKQSPDGFFDGFRERLKIIYG